MRVLSPGNLSDDDKPSLQMKKRSARFQRLTEDGSLTFLSNRYLLHQGTEERHCSAEQELLSSSRAPGLLGGLG